MQSLRSFVLLILLALVAVTRADAAEQAIFGPVKYDVKERYGKPNHYTATVPAKDAVYVIKLQNGAAIGEKVDWMELTVNGEKVVRNDKYAYPYIAVFARLKSENTIELLIRDDYPAGMKRPPAYPKNVTITVLPAPAEGARLKTSLGLADWSNLPDAIGSLSKLSGPAAALAMDAVNLQLDVAKRTESLRTLSDLKDKALDELLNRMYGDALSTAQVRAEAAVALGAQGDKKSIPVLMQGILDPEEIVSTASARGLSFYPESDTRELLIKTLEKLDNLRKDGAIRTIVKGGWKPIATMITLSETSDAHVAETALGVLGSMQVPAATDYLLTSLKNPGKRSPLLFVRALGDTGDPRAVDALLALAADTQKRAGLEGDLADSLAKLGDKRAADAIKDMAKNASSFYVESRLRSAYRRLTGQDL